jgi:MerR family transcriptional regulator/heat shock protein HspR
MKSGTEPKDGNRPVYTLGIAAELAEIPTHSIRQYIDRGLLIPYKLESRRHLFSRNDIHRLKNIHALIRDYGLNFAGIRVLMAHIPCWAMRGCSREDRERCNAYSDLSQPCWEASEKGTMCKNVDCKTCEAYHILTDSLGLKHFLQEML